MHRSHDTNKGQETVFLLTTQHPHNYTTIVRYSCIRILYTHNPAAVGSLLANELWLAAIWLY